MHSPGNMSLRPPKAPPTATWRTYTLETGSSRTLASPLALVWGLALGIQTWTVPWRSQWATTA